MKQGKVRSTALVIAGTIVFFSAFFILAGRRELGVSEEVTVWKHDKAGKAYSVETHGDYYLREKIALNAVESSHTLSLNGKQRLNFVVFKASLGTIPLPDMKDNAGTKGR